MRKLFSVVTVIAALAAIAIPASASAYTSNWKDGTSEFSGTRTLELHGSASFTGGTSCPANSVVATVALQGGTGTAEVTAFGVVSPGSCTVTGTLASLGCTELESETTENLNYMADDEGSYIKLSGGPIKLVNKYKGGAFCPKTVTLEEKSGEELRATPDSTTAITKLTLSGTIHTSLGTTSTVSGEMTPVNAGDSGTYGL